MKQTTKEDMIHLIELCRTIITKLKNNAELDEINKLSELRDDLISRIQTNPTSLEIIDEAIIQELKKLHAEEALALEPYRRDAANCRQALIKLKQTEAYLTSDL